MIVASSMLEMNSTRKVAVLSRNPVAEMRFRGRTCCRRFSEILYGESRPPTSGGRAAKTSLRVDACASGGERSL